MIRQLSLKRILVDGVILNLLLTVIVYGSLYVNPSMLVDSYPPDVRAAVGDVNVPAGQLVVFYTLSMGTVVGVTLWSNAKLRRQNGGDLSFLTAFAHSALLLFSFAAWDLLILDWLIFVTIQPDFIVIPGTEGLAGYRDYWFHFEVSFGDWIQWISILVGGLVLAGVSMIRLKGTGSAEVNSGPEYYLRNQGTLLKEQAKMADAGQAFAAERYGQAFADTLFRESLAEFDALIPKLPYIGGKQNPLTGNLVSAAGALAVYRVMQRHGKPIEETGELLYHLMEAWIRRYPRLVRHLMGRYYLSRLSQRQSKKRSALSQQRRYPADWVRVHIDGDGQAFDWGMDYLECGIVKFLHSQGADELAPYLCRTDYALFGALGIELERTMTLAEGGEKCDFRLKRADAAPA